MKLLRITGELTDLMSRLNPETDYFIQKANKRKIIKLGLNCSTFYLTKEDLIKFDYTLDKNLYLGDLVELNKITCRVMSLNNNIIELQIVTNNPNDCLEINII